MNFLQTNVFTGLALLFCEILCIAFLISLCAKGKKEEDNFVKKSKKKKAKRKGRKKKRRSRNAKSALIRSNYAYARDHSSGEDEEDDKTEIIDPATGRPVKTTVGKAQVTDTENGDPSEFSSQLSYENVGNNRKDIGNLRNFAKPSPKADYENIPIRYVSDPNLEKLEPNKLKMGDKEKRIREGEIRGKLEYPTMDDVVSEWDEDKKKTGKDKQPITEKKVGIEDGAVKSGRVRKMDEKGQPEPFIAKSSKEICKSAKQANLNKNLEFTAKDE